jgi:hypothetical protein
MPPQTPTKKVDQSSPFSQPSEPHLPLPPPSPKIESQQQQNISPITVDDENDAEDEQPEEKGAPVVAPTAITEPIPGNRQEEDTSPPPVNLKEMPLCDSLPPHDLTKLLNIICHYIENLEEPLIVKKSYFIAANPSSSSNLTKKNIDNAMDNAGLDELDTTPETIPAEVFTWIVLKIAEEKGSYLLPR